MRMTRWLHPAVLALLAVCAGDAQAHFLFIRISPMAEAGRTAEVYFSEQAEAGDPRFIEKVAQTKLWVQTEPGQFQELTVRQGADRLRATLPASGSVAVVGLCEYGVLARPNQTPFLLRYYPKAVAGAPDALNRLTPRQEIPLEIVARIEGDRLKLTALRQGKPLPDAVFHTVDADLTSGEVKAGADGTAVWQPPAYGRYSIYVRDTLKQSGTHDGKSYEEIREFATLALEWPLERKGADAEAVALFEEALATRAAWNDFTGFSAEATGSVDGRPFTGKVAAQADGTVKVETDDPVARPWLEDQLGSLVMHRLADSGSDTKPVLRFADEPDEHPLGRLLVFEGGRFASSYRVKDRQITVVNRHTGRRNMTITVLENERNRDGKFLPRRYLVHYWDAASGRLDHVETVQERWQRVGAWDLPTEHTVTSASDSGLSVRQVMLKYK
ncbi:MAG: DUF3386 family protein [Isosphaeraceae bacterium]|nr:DUF3386 family protein [Isosphaeraceae bacterium]